MLETFLGILFPVLFITVLIYFIINTLKDWNKPTLSEKAIKELAEAAASLGAVSTNHFFRNYTAESIRKTQEIYSRWSESP